MFTHVYMYTLYTVYKRVCIHNICLYMLHVSVYIYIYVCIGTYCMYVRVIIHVCMYIDTHYMYTHCEHIFTLVMCCIVTEIDH